MKSGTEQRRADDVERVQPRRYETLSEVDFALDQAGRALAELKVIESEWDTATAPVRSSLKRLADQIRRTHHCNTGPDDEEIYGKPLGSVVLRLRLDAGAKWRRASLFTQSDELRWANGPELKEWRDAGAAVKDARKTIGLLETVRKSFKPKKVSPQGNLF